MAAFEPCFAPPPPAGVAASARYDAGGGDDDLSSNLSNDLSRTMDGTLGGLTALAPNMHRYLDDVARMSELCSNDPLCTETTSSSLPEDRGCYSCSYNSETSCKHFNLSLDRLLLRECVGLQ